LINLKHNIGKIIIKEGWYYVNGCYRALSGGAAIASILSFKKESNYYKVSGI
jgi:hypothetical protein